MAGSVYWLGADGNIYLKGADGVKNVGKPYGPNPLQDKGFDSNQISAEATRIADPNAPVAAGPANSNGAAKTTVPADKSNDIALNNAGLGAVDSQTNTGLSAVDKALGGLIGQYDTEAAANQTNYKTQSDTNENNLQKNKETALVNAAQGRQGLNGTLASLGALNGSGIQLADRAVQNGANADLSGASDNFATNQTGLDTAIGTFKSEDAKRRQDAQTAADNARTTVNNDSAKSRQGFYTNLANDYSAQGDSANANKYSGLAASLFPSIAATTVPNSNIAYSGAAFTPGTLSSYLAGNGNTTVATTPSTNGGQPGLVATTAKKKQLVTA